MPLEKSTITILVLMIETSFLYHSFGVRDVVCTRCEYTGNKTIIHVRPTRTLRCCPHCHSYTLHLSEKICRIIWLFKILFVPLRTTKKKGELEWKRNSTQQSRNRLLGLPKQWDIQHGWLFLLSWQNKIVASSVIFTKNYLLLKQPFRSIWKNWKKLA